MATPSRSSTLTSPTARYSTSSSHSVHSNPVVSAINTDNPLTTLIRRLEAATSRLEDIALSAGSFDTHSNGTSPTPTHNLPTTSSAPELVGGVAGAGGAKGLDQASAPATPPSEPLPPAIEAMDELLETDVKAFVEASKSIDPLIEEQASSVAKAFADQRRFLLVTTKAKKPDMSSSETFNVLLKDLQQDMTSVGDIKDSNRASPMKEHLAMVGEGIGVLQWLLMEGKPADFVKDTIGGAQMYGNRVLMKYKEKDQSHVKFVQSYYSLLKALAAYIAKHYLSGVTWNANGTDALEAYREAASSSAPATNGAPPPAPPPPYSGAPPPPPPPLPNFDNIPGAPPPPPPGGAPKGQSAAGGGDMGAVFEQLNRGESVTAGLKKVDKSQMTHKNPSLRAQGAADSRSKSPGPDVKPKPQSMRQNSSASVASSQQGKKAAAPAVGKKELDGNKWLIENFDSPGQPIEVEVTLNQSLLISRCKNTTIILRGKANALSIDNSPRTQLLVETLVSSVDVIKCPNFALQVTGSLPTVMLDQVDGASIYLGKESMATEVFTSKCSSINIVLPPEGEEDDSVESPVPEQIRTYVKGGRLVSEIVEHAG